PKRPPPSPPPRPRAAMPHLLLYGSRGPISPSRKLRTSACPCSRGIRSAGDTAHCRFGLKRSESRLSTHSVTWSLRHSSTAERSIGTLHDVCFGCAVQQRDVHLLVVVEHRQRLRREEGRVLRVVLDRLVRHEVLEVILVGEDRRHRSEEHTSEL